MRRDIESSIDRWRTTPCQFTGVSKRIKDMIIFYGRLSRNWFDANYQLREMDKGASRAHRTGKCGDNISILAICVGGMYTTMK